jgi:glycosyltransferase involved in cell wall biosynthesis
MRKDLKVRTTRFNIVIPTIKGREDVLRRAVNSVKDQRYKNWRLYIVHDNYGNVTYDLTKRNNITEIFCERKFGAGGARNLAIDLIPKVSDEYTLFLDDDDYISNIFVLKELNEFISSFKNKPDMIRLGYVKHYQTGAEKRKLISPEESDLEIAVKSPKVGVSCKAIKSSKLVKFPEDVKHQDMVHHIDQCDACDTCAVWNRVFFTYSIYDRPDKNPNSPECQKALRELPDILDNLKLRRTESREAANIWKERIKRWYGNA